MLETKDRIEHGKWLLTELNNWNSRIDGRVAFISTVNAAFLILAASFVFGKDSYSTEEIALMIVYGLSCIVAAYLLYAVQFPKLLSPNSSIIFFGSIAELSKEEYILKVKTQSEDDIEKDIYIQCHRNSEIISSKFYWLKLSYYSSMISICLWLLLISFLNHPSSPSQ